MNLALTPGTGVLLVLLVSFGMGGREASPAYASVLIFGVPGDVVQSFLGREAHVVSFLEIRVDGPWMDAKDFVLSSKGEIVESGNAYHIGASLVFDPEHPVTPESILVGDETGIRFPLKVVEVREDPVTLVFRTPGGVFSTYFDTGVSDKIVAYAHGGHNGEWVGKYVLVNGIMLKTQDRWAPEPISQNAQVRINGSIYNCSLVYVYYFPWAH